MARSRVKVRLVARRSARPGAPGEGKVVAVLGWRAGLEWELIYVRGEAREQGILVAWVGAGGRLDLGMRGQRVGRGDCK